MRSFALPPAALVAGILVWSCTVYDSGLVPGAGGLTGGAGASTTGGSKSSAGSGSMSVAGKSATAGSLPLAEGGAGNTTMGGADSMPPEGGQGNEAGESATGGGGMPGGAQNGDSAGSGGAATAGTAGSGGTGVMSILCADHPLTMKTTWKATASSSSVGDGTEASGLYNPPEHLIDAKFNERWSSGKSQLGDEWIEIDFGMQVTLSDITLNVNNDTGDYPRAWAVRVSNTEQNFAAPVRAMGDGMPGNTVISLPAPVTGRYLLVRQTGMNEPMVTAWWTVAEVLVSCQD
jgi:hypothetical protein